MSTATVTLPATTSPALPAPVRVGRVPFLGALPGMLMDGPGYLLAASRANDGEVFSLQLGPVAVPVVTAVEDLQQVLLDDARSYSKGGMWSAVRPLLGNGLVTSDGDVWKRQRQLMQPLFTPRYIHSLSSLMVQAIDAQIERMKTHTHAPIDVATEMTLITQQVLMESMFGASLSLEKAWELGRHLATAFQTMNVRLFTYFLPEWFPRPGGRDHFAAIAAIDAALLDLVAERRADPREHSDLLSLLLEAVDPETGAPLADREIRDQLVTLFVAGLDTTAITLTWTLHLLDLHCDVDARVRAEIAAVIGDRLPTADDIPKLTYTKQVIQESMRLYPPAWIFPRYVANGAVVGGKQIKAGSSLLISPFLTHRDPKHWDRPDEFDPERFTPAATAARPRLSYIPFGAGGRMCIGSHFAMMEGMLGIVMLLQRFRAKGVGSEPVVPVGAGTLKPKGGLSMMLEAI